MSILLTSAVIAALVSGFISGLFARNVKISKFRQTWINELRKDVADYIGAAHRWIRKYEQINHLEQNPDRLELERKELLPISNEARVILWRIRLRINPRQDNPDKKQDDAFLKCLDDLLNPGKIPPPNLEASWLVLANGAVEKAREILKREWEVTKRLLWWRRIAGLWGGRW
jgi:hypothetical protein